MKLATVGFLISAIVIGGYLLGKVNTALGLIALGFCIACVAAQLVLFRRSSK